MFHDAVLDIHYNKVTSAEEKEAQNNSSKASNAYEMWGIFDVQRFRFCLIKLTIRKIIAHVHDTSVTVTLNSSHHSSEKYAL